MLRHIIVSGDNALATTIAEELRAAGASIIKLKTEELAHADFSRASAVVCAGDNDAKNLEIALLARKANPKLRVVARLSNDVLREAMAEGNGAGAILDVAELAVPSVMEACLSQKTHPFEAAGIDFVVAGSEARYDGTLRELYADLAPVAVIGGKNSPMPGEVVACPGRDLPVRTGDWTAMIGTAEELATRGFKVPVSQRTQHSWPRRIVDVFRAVRDNANPMLYPSLGLMFLLIMVSTVTVRLSYRPEMSWIDAVYFTAETITTVGYGDFSFAHQETWLRIFAATMMFAGVTTTALIVAFVADLLLSRRFVQTAGARRARHLRNHVVVIGLGSFGIRVVSELAALGHDVVVIERDEDNRYLTAADELDVPVIFGDATMRQTLKAANVQRARAIAVLTRTDIVNIEVGIMLLEMLGTRDSEDEGYRTKAPLVLRVFDRALGDAVAKRFGFENVRSTVDLAAPWFIGAAMGLQVLGTFSVGQRSFMVGGMRVAADSELDGLLMLDVSTQTRVFAITRPDAPTKLHPRRDTRLHAGDIVYLVGPYRELLATLAKGQPPQPTDAPQQPSPKAQIEGRPAEVRAG